MSDDIYVAAGGTALIATQLVGMRAERQGHITRRDMLPQCAG